MMRRGRDYRIASERVRENRVNQSGSVALSADEVRGPPYASKDVSTQPAAA
jgi:hypothetical protein